jgi:hypothetical protein
MPVVPQGNYSKTTTATKTALTAKTAAGGTKGTTATAAAKAAAAKKIAAPVVVKKPVAKKPIDLGWDEAPPVGINPVRDVPPVTVPEEPAWTLEGDPVYQSALSAGQAQFNYARNAALAEQQNTQTAKAQERKSLDVNSAESRRRLAGNYASRGMAGGFAGAASQAEARANAEQIAARTSIAEQLTALNEQYLQNFGATGTDWTGTLVGQQYKTQAAQAAITNRLAQYGVQ